MGQQMPMRPLGRTGEQVSVVGLGGFHLGNMGEAESERVVRTALDNGVTFLDNSWDYHDGAREERMGRALVGGYRDRAFLMTKIDGRRRRAARGQIDESPRTFRPLSSDEVAALLARTAAPSHSGTFEAYKTTKEHDSTSLSGSASAHTARILESRVSWRCDPPQTAVSL